MRFVTHSLLAPALVLASLAGPAVAADRRSGSEAPPAQTASASTGSAALSLVVGPPHAIDLPGDAKEVFVSNPDVVSATVRGQRKLLLVGKTPGQSEIFVNDASGRSLSSYSVVVSRNLDELREAVRTVAPEASIRINGVGRQVILTGEAPSPEVARQVEEAVRAMLGQDERFVVSQVKLREPSQVMIKVTVAEVRRSVLRQLGVKVKGNWSVGNMDLGLGSLTQNTGQSVERSEGKLSRNGGDAMITLNALDRNGALRTLAEPTLTAASGQRAEFQAGGEVPVPGPLECEGGRCRRTILYKEVGVKLNFTPTVLNSGRISLSIDTTVNEVDSSVAFNFDGILVPGFRTRTMRTTVELPSGASIMTAGLLQQQNVSTIEGTPGLASLPVLGVLFRSKDYQRAETELLIVAVPYIAKPDKPGSGPLPTDGYVLEGDAKQVLIGRLSKKYGSAPDLEAARGVGFIAR